MADYKKNNKFNTTLLIISLAAIALGAIIVLYPVYLKKEKLKESNHLLHEQLKNKEYERADLARDVHALANDPHMVEKVARDKFRLCREGEIILLYKEKEK